MLRSSTSFSTFVSGVTETKWWSISAGEWPDGSSRLDPRGRRRIQVRQLADLAVERGREEHRLPLGGKAPDDLVDLRLEAHVEHPIGLVEDEDGDRVERDEPAIDEILQAARRRYEYMRRAGSLGLRAQRHAPVDGRDLQVTGGRECLPCRPSPPTASSRVGTSTSALGHVALRSRFSTIGIANASVLPEPVGDFDEHVAAAQGFRDRAGLDVERGVDTARGERADDVCAHAERSKRYVRQG